MSEAPTDPVLIVGGGPVGLTSAILLARLGVPSLLVERRGDVTDHPRSRVINTRSVEIFRACGLEQALAQVSLPEAWREQVVYTTTLSGTELGRIRTTAWAGDPELSPVTPLLSSQDRIEPVLRDCAKALPGTDLRFGVQLVGFRRDDRGVTATLLDRARGERQERRASYLIGADGAGSFVRQELGIGLTGTQGIASLMNVYFLADFSAWTAGRPATLYWVNTEEVAGVLAPLDGRDRWVCQIGYDTAREGPQDFTPERCRKWIRAAVGNEAVPIEIRSINPWTMSSVVAERLREGRVFLAGDAAHLMPPTGGFGMNTGIQSAHNLAWKLAAVIQGWADASLLDSYETERVPVARYNGEKSLEHFLMVARVNATVRESIRSLPGAKTSGTKVSQAIEAARRYGNFIGMDLGFAYEKGALVPDGTPPPEIEDPVGRYEPTARPGHRAPHSWLERGGSALSTLDLFDRGFTLLLGRRGDAWAPAAGELASNRGIPLAVHRIAPGAALEDPGGRFLERYGIDEDGAVLVRPDGHVAWRSASGVAAPRLELEKVFAALGVPTTELPRRS